MRTTVLMLTLAFLPLSVALAGCAADDAPAAEEPTPTPPATNESAEAPAPVAVDVRTTGTYPVDPGYAPAEVTVASGAEVTVTFTNAEQNPVSLHDWVVEGVEGAATAQIGSGETDTVTFTAPAPGEYAFFCSVGDHRARGMEGKLIVAAAA